VAVIIVNHNAGALLIDSVRAALAQAEQVIVVDNDSSDASMDLLANQFPREARRVTLCETKNCHSVRLGSKRFGSGRE